MHIKNEYCIHILKVINDRSYPKNEIKRHNVIVSLKINHEATETARFLRV